jgi:hypothetical protein
MVPPKNARATRVPDRLELERHVGLGLQQFRIDAEVVPPLQEDQGREMTEQGGRLDGGPHQ